MMNYKNFQEYKLIKSIYGDKKARRSQVPLINHIDEGIEILKSIGATPLAVRAYCLHPIFQDGLELNKNRQLAHDQDPYVLMLAMEYRQIANAYLSFREIDGLDDIKLSPLSEVNEMLVADKIQNFKDFMRYHHKTHPRSGKLHRYFNNWFKKLNIDSQVFTLLEQSPDQLPLKTIKDTYNAKATKIKGAQKKPNKGFTP